MVACVSSHKTRELMGAVACHSSSPEQATEQFLVSVGYRVRPCLETLNKYPPVEYGRHQDVSLRVGSWS